MKAARMLMQIRDALSNLNPAEVRAASTSAGLDRSVCVYPQDPGGDGELLRAGKSDVERAIHGSSRAGVRRGGDSKGTTVIRIFEEGVPHPTRSVRVSPQQAGKSGVRHPREAPGTEARA